MDRFIGLDAHASSCALGVVSPSGRRVGSHVLETNARCLNKMSLKSRFSIGGTAGEGPRIPRQLPHHAQALRRRALNVDSFGVGVVKSPDSDLISAHGVAWVKRVYDGSGT